MIQDPFLLLELSGLNFYTIIVGMKFKHFFLAPLLFIVLYFGSYSPPYSFAQQNPLSMPSISPYWIKRAPYSTTTSLVLSKPKGGQMGQDNSFFSAKNLPTIIPSFIGGFSIFAGSLFTWLRVKRKNKMFKDYMQKISVEEEKYDKSKGVKALKEQFLNFQNEIDLLAANKKIDEEQRTTLSHAMERKLSELSKSKGA